MRRVLATSLLCFACLLGLAGSASAHAVLENSSPARGAQLKTAPEHVSFTFDEPVTRLFPQGMVHKDGEVKSKSKGNTVAPDDMIKAYGADTLRL